MITVTATASPAGTYQITFTLTQSYQFTFSDGTTAPKTVSTNAQGVATVTIKSLTYYGVAKVKANAPNGVNDEKQIPVDTDNDLISDQWEKDNGGGTSSPWLDPNADNENVSGITQPGDGFTVLNEYKGYKIGTTHARMNPTKKEIFYDTSSDATQRQFAKERLIQQLGLTVIDASADPVFLGSQTKGRFRYAKKTTWNDDPLLAPQYNGDIWDQDGNDPAPPFLGVKLGDAPLNYGSGEARIFETTNSNVFTKNRVKETTNKTISASWSTPTSLGVTWFARFSNSDLTGDGDKDDLVNVFDLFSTGSTNDPVNNPPNFAGFTSTQWLQITTPHESGHLVHINHPDQASPPQNPLTASVIAVRNGFG